MDLISLHSTSAHNAMYCRSFRDDDILKCPEQFCSFWLYEPAPRRATLPRLPWYCGALHPIYECNDLCRIVLCLANTALVLRWLEPLKLRATIAR